jgi:hypothetical protein
LASSRRAGTNESISDYEGGSPDYTEGQFGTWEAATDNNNVTGAVSPVLEVYAEGGGGSLWDETAVDFLGGTNNATYMRIVRPAAGNKHSGIIVTDGSAAGFRDAATTPSYLFQLADTGPIYFQDLIITRTGIDNLYDCGIKVLSGCTAHVVGCLVFGFEGRGIQLESGGAIAVNCVVHAVDRCMFTSGITVYCYNVTENGCTRNSIFNSGTATTKNCVWDTAISNSGTHNQTTNVTGTPTYVDAAGDDFHLDPDDTVALDNGTDLSADGTFAFDDDIDGDTRSGTWDVGFDEVVSGAQEVAPNAADHAHAVDAVTVTRTTSVSANDTLHAHAADAAVVSRTTGVTAAETLHAHAADGVTVTAVKMVIPAETSHAHSVDGVTIEAILAIVPDDTLHAHSADGATVLRTTSLVAADALHDHLADNITIDTFVKLVAADALHAHGVDGVTIEAILAIVPDDTLHAHLADGATVLRTTTLSLDDTLHDHLADNVTIDTFVALAAADALHAHAVDSVTLTAISSLILADALHAHTVDNVTITIAGGVTIAVQECLHIHTADGVDFAWSKILIKGIDVISGEPVRIIGWYKLL